MMYLPVRGSRTSQCTRPSSSQEVRVWLKSILCSSAALAKPSLIVVPMLRDTPEPRATYL